MATVRTTTERLDEFQDLAETVEEIQAPDEISRIMGILGSDESGEVFLSKRMEGSRERYAMLTKYSGKEFDPMLVKDEYGSGDYKVVIHAKGKLGTVKATEYFSIYDTSKPLVKDATPEFRDRPQNELLMVLSAMQEKTTSMLEGIGRLVVRQPQTSSNDSEEKFLDKMIKYKELFSNQGTHNQGNNQNPAMMMEMFMKGLELAKDIGSGGETSSADIFKTVIKEFAPVAVEAMKTAQASAQVKQNDQHRLIQQNASFPNPQIIPQGEPMPLPPIDTEQEKDLKSLLMFQKMHVSPETVAELIYAKIENEETEIPILLNPELVVKLVERYPEFKIEWLQLVQNEIRQIHESPYEEEDDVGVSVGGNDGRPERDGGNTLTDAGDHLEQ